MAGPTAAAFAGPVPLTGEDLKEKVTGALVEIDTPLGTKIPVRFGADGLVSGEAGELAPLLGSAKDRGRWWISGDKLCSKWFRWFDAEENCITVRQQGARLFWRQDNGKTGTATLVETPKAKPEPPALVAKAETAPRGAAAAADKSSKGTAPKAVAAATSPPAPPPAEPVPLPVRSPVRVAAADVAPETPAPAPAPVAETFSDVPMMRFGGAGLLEASARIALAVPMEPEDQPGNTAEEAAAEESAPRTASSDAETETPRAGTVVAELPAARTTPAPERQIPPKAAAASTGPSRTAATTKSVPSVATSALRERVFYRVRGVGRRDVLNVRRGPAESHALVAVIPSNGRRIEITGACRGDWCPIRYGTTAGWVHSFYLTEERPRRGSASPVYLARP